MLKFAWRNLIVFFRDKSAVFFSLLAVFIIIGLYALFLGDVWASGSADIPEMRQIMDLWITAGVLAVTSVTTTMGAFGIMVEDRSKKILKDFYCAPIKRSKLVGGYILSAFTVGVIMSVVALVLCQIYILFSGGQWLGFIVLLKTLALILISTLSGTSMVLFLTMFFKSSNAFATASAVIGTLIGFLTGLYIPIGSLPQTVQSVIKIFPTAHAAALYRQVIMKSTLGEAFAHAPPALEENFRQMLGVNFTYGAKPMPAFVNIAVLVGTAVLFFALAVYTMSKKKK